MLAMCPKCHHAARPIQVGDEGGQRPYWVVQCSHCYYEAADCDKAKVDCRDAIKLWNERINKENEV